MANLEGELPTIGVQSGCCSSLGLSMGILGTEGESRRVHFAEKADVVSAFADGGITEDAEDLCDGSERAEYFGALGQRMHRAAGSLPVAHAHIIFNPDVEGATLRRRPGQEAEMSGVQDVKHAGHDYRTNVLAWWGVTVPAQAQNGSFLGPPDIDGPRALLIWNFESAKVSVLSRDRHREPPVACRPLFRSALPPKRLISTRAL
jgi:hypothetical protein